MGQERDDLLIERARKLAFRPTEEAFTKDALLLTVFKLGTEKYALDSIWIREVFPLEDVSHIPGVPSFVYGLINIRRRIISLVDLRPLFEVSAPALNVAANVIVLQKEAMEFGIIAEEIVGLRSICQDDLQEALPTLTGVRQEFLKGITADRLLVLDAEKLLSSSTLIVDQGHL